METSTVDGETSESTNDIRPGPAWPEDTGVTAQIDWSQLSVVYQSYLLSTHSIGFLYRTCPAEAIRIGTATVPPAHLEVPRLRKERSTIHLPVVLRLLTFWINGIPARYYFILVMIDLSPMPSVYKLIQTWPEIDNMLRSW